MGYRNIRKLNLELPGGKLGEHDSVASEESAERSPQGGLTGKICRSRTCDFSCQCG